MRPTNPIVRSPALRAAVLITALSMGGTAGAQQHRISKSAELLPSFPEEALKDRSVVFSNATYEAWVSKDGYLRATPLKDGKPAGPTIRLFSPHFRGSEDRGGYVIHEEVENFRAETKLPARQPMTAVRYRADAEYGGKLTVSISFGERAINVDAKYSRTKGTGSTVAHPGAVISALPGFTKLFEDGVPPDLTAKCEGKYIDLIPESGQPMLISFSDDTRKMELPYAKEWTIRGLWDGIALRGRTSTKGYTFRYGQYMGHMPAQGFWFFYSLSKSTDSTKVSFEFEPYDGSAPAVPATGPGRR